MDEGKTKLARLRMLAVIEGVSLLVLVCIAMPLKHFAHVPMATRVVGLVHGLAFLAYVASVIDAFGTRHLTGKEAALAVVAAIVPGGTFVFVRRLP
jgi:integral membrane protein